MSNLESTIRVYYETRELCHKDVYKHLTMLRKSLYELKLVSKKTLLENTLYWQKELEKVKQEKDQEWQGRIRKIEAENKQLRTVIKDLEKSDESKKTNELCLCKQVDHLNRQLDKKLIHVNKLQLALAEQSKAMFELEKSYVLLYRRYAKVCQRENCRTESKLENS